MGSACMGSMADFFTAVSLWPGTRPGTRPGGKRRGSGILLCVSPLQKADSPPCCHFVAMGLDEIRKSVVVYLALLNATTTGNSFLSPVTEPQLRTENCFHLENI